MFGLIDHELIGMGFEKTYKNQEPRKMLGVSAAKEYLKENNEDYSKKIIFIYLFFLNIMEVLKTLLADGNNFTNEPDMINRNFISHGMSHRMVSDIDCFRVWLALYGLAVILPQLEETLE